MYRNVAYLPNKQVMRLFTWDESGNRITYDTSYEPYIYLETNSHADARSIFNTPLRKRSFRTQFERYKYVNENLGSRIFENLPPAQQFIVDTFGGQNEAVEFSKFPLKVYYVDIETYSPKEFPVPEKAADPINVITIYNSLNNAFTTWGTKPLTEPIDNCNYIFCETEAKMLRTFIKFLSEDTCDILSGWNCISANQKIWLSDRIIPISQISNFSDNNTLRAYGNKVNNYAMTGIKPEFQLANNFGHFVKCSGDHKIMVHRKQKHTYKNFNTLTECIDEMRVEDIAKSLESEDIYTRVHLNTNTNKDQTFRDLILKNFDYLYDHSLFDFYITDTKIKSLISDNAKVVALIPTPNHWYGENFWKKTSKWRFSVLKSYIPKIEIYNYLKSVKTLMYTNCIHSRAIVLDQIIPNNLLQLIGFVFTDGTLDRKENVVGYSSKYGNIVEAYTMHFKANIHNKISNIAGIQSSDNCFYKKIAINNKFGCLLPLIYNTSKQKHPNIEILSQLSYNQFVSFFAGMIDGDGHVHKNNAIELCNYDCVKYNFLEDMTQLLLWNGVTSRTFKNYIAINFYSINKTFITDVKKRMHHQPRVDAINQSPFIDKLNSAAKDISWYFDDQKNDLIIKVEKCELTGESVEMWDIETDDHTFLCNGMLVHNCEFFDIPYIINRITNVLGAEEANSLSPTGRITSRLVRNKFGKEQMRWYIEAIACIDYLEIYRKFCFSPRESYKLNSIAEIEISEGKVDFGDQNLASLADTDWDTFVRYNVQDVNLLVKMEKKLKYLELLRMIAYAGCATLENALGTLSVVNGLCAVNAHSRNLKIPTFNREVKDSKKNEGAYVADPVRGFQEHLVSVDANSLYPNIMITLNLSPETKVGKITNSTDTHVTIQHVNGQEFVLTKANFNHFIAKEYIAISKADILFSQKQKGMVPMIVDEYYQRRIEIRNKYKKYKKKISSLDEEIATLEKQIAEQS